MAVYTVYIIFSQRLDRFYIGTTDNFAARLSQHNDKLYPKSFTTKGIPWVKYVLIPDLHSQQAYEIEKHLKKMKSKKYIENLTKYPELIDL